jgi:hypothetical protein
LRPKSSNLKEKRSVLTQNVFLCRKMSKFVTAVTVELAGKTSILVFFEKKL